MLVTYLFGLTLMGGAVAFYMSQVPERYLLIGEYNEVIKSWYVVEGGRNAQIKLKVCKIKQSSVWLAITICIMWPISIIPCAGYLAGSRMRTRA